MRDPLPGDVWVVNGVIYFVFARLGDRVWCYAVTKWPGRTRSWGWWPMKLLVEEGWQPRS